MLFSRRVFTRQGAKDWAREHGFFYGDVDSKPNTWRLRQGQPEAYGKGYFRTITLTTGIKAVIGVAKERVKETMKPRKPHSRRNPSNERDTKIAKRVASVIWRELRVREKKLKLSDLESRGLDLHAYLVEAPEFAAVYNKMSRHPTAWVDKLALLIEDELAKKRAPLTAKANARLEARLAKENLRIESWWAVSVDGQDKGGGGRTKKEAYFIARQMGHFWPGRRITIQKIEIQGNGVTAKKIGKEFVVPPFSDEDFRTAMLHPHQAGYVPRDELIRRPNSTSWKRGKNRV